MQDTRLQTLAKAVSKRQDRYQRNTPLFDQLVQLSVRGHPGASELFARRLHRDLDEVLATLRAHPELEYDAHGNIVGSGLTFRPTAHQFQVKQQILFAWCAFDTLTYPVELHMSAHITSWCPVTGRSILLSVTSEQVRALDPPGAVVSLVAHETAECCHDVREGVCNYGHFFVSREVATQWQAAHSQALILSVKEAYQVGKLVEGHRSRKES
jgi:alkylmercury lyase